MLLVSSVSKSLLRYVPGIRYPRRSVVPDLPEIRNVYPKRSICDLPTEILVNIFSHTSTVDHIILSLCSKQLSRISQDLIAPVVLPRRGSLIYQTYKEHMELLVRLARSVPEDYRICWYCGFFLPWTDEWNTRSSRAIKLWEGAPSKTIRAYYCPRCTSQAPKNRERVANFLRLSWRSNDRRERKNWYMSRQADKIVWAGLSNQDSWSVKRGGQSAGSSMRGRR
jgi:F-box domain